MLFYRQAATRQIFFFDSAAASTVINMASCSRASAIRKTLPPRVSSASTVDFSDESGSDDSECEVTSSDFTSSEDSGDDQPGTSSGAGR